jgi:hypothetical protein
MADAGTTSQSAAQRGAPLTRNRAVVADVAVACGPARLTRACHTAAALLLQMLGLHGVSASPTALE